MLSTLIRLCFAALILTGSYAMNASADDSGWRPLFNGKDLDGWQHVGPGRFVIENGVLRTEGGMGLLWYTREKFGDATIRVVFRALQPKGAGNSGLFIRIPAEPTEPWMPVTRAMKCRSTRTTVTSIARACCIR